MGKRRRFEALLIAALCVTVTVAGPLSSQIVDDYPVDDTDTNIISGRTSDAKCSTQCPDRSLPWSYEVGKTYSYVYSVQTTTSMKGTSNQESVLDLKATVDMTVNSACDFSMKVSDISLGKDVTDAIVDDLKRHELHFSFVDGRVSDVCASQKESTHALNIKKGILSAFQVASEDWIKSQNITETDVTGICSTEYIPTVSNPAGITTFQKIKDMKSCKFNQKLFQFALNLPDLNVQHLSLIESDHTCEVQLSEGHLQKSVCQENHIFKPFSSGDHGATTRQEQTLEMISVQSSQTVPLRGLAKRGNLLFDHHTDARDADSNLAIVTKILSEYPTSDEANRPEMFTSLVHSLRHLHHSQLSHIFYKIEDFNTRKLVLDAIPLLRTDAAVLLMRDIIASGQLTDATLDTWFASLAFYKNPTRAMVTIVTNFLDANPRESALLAVSSLVRTFCETQSNCQQLPEVQAIILKYEEYLGADCTGDGAVLDGEDEDRIILSLKGLRNMGMTLRSGPILEKCYLEKTNSMYIRLAALDTLKMLSCKSKVHEPGLVNTFSDIGNDSELRIGAYLAIMNCPTESTVETVKRVLVSEPVNQVGSFIWTHLTNLQESQSLSPSTINAKKLIGDKFLQNKWNTDVRKFSRYFETSYYSKELQAGATVEGNVIFSQESYLPRSAMLNLSVNVFGENLNLVEVGGRAEGFETLVEGLFGPDGRFREDTFHKLLQGMRRNKREADDLADFQSTFNAVREDKPKGNFYVRSFGRDTHYTSFHGINELFNKITFWPNSVFGKTWTGNDVDFRRSSIFLDGSIIVPTMAGLPLKLSVNGTTTVALKSSTTLDVSNFFGDGRLSAEAHVYPTATVQVTGIMEVEAGGVKTGLKSVTKLHSSTFMDGKVIIDGGKLAKLEVNMPRDTMEILEASADFFIWKPSDDVQADDYVPLKSENTLEEYVGCSTDGNGLLGVEVCAVAKYYHAADNDLALYFTGPSLAKLSLKKTDQFSKYVFEYSWTTKSMDEATNKIVNDVKLTYDTPGSNVARRSSLEVKFDTVLSYVAVSVEIPINKINADLVYNWTPEKKMLKAGVAVDRQNALFLYTIFKVADDQGRYGAEARITYYDTDFLRWIGTVVLQDKRKSLDLKLEGSLHNPLKLTADLYTSPDRYDLTSALRATGLSLDLAGQLRHTDTSLAVKADVTYKLPDIGAHKLNIEGSYQMGGLGKLQKHHAQISVIPSQFPNLATNLAWDTQISADYIENSGKLTVGSRAYNFEQVFSSQATDDLQELIFKVAVIDAVNDLQYKIDFLHKVGALESNNRLALSFHRHHLEAFASHKMSASPETSLNVSAGLVIPGGYNYGLGFEVGQVQSNDYAGKTFIRWGPEEESDKKISAEFNFQKGNEAHINYGFSVTVTLPNLQTIASSGTLIFDPAAGSVLHLSWSRNKRRYSAEIEYSVVDLEHQIDAKVVINDVEYKATVRASDRDTKSIVIDVLAGRHYLLEAEAKDTFKNMKLDIFWDKESDDTRRISLKSELTSRDLDIQFRFVDHQGEMKAKLVDDGLQVEAKFNEHYVKARAAHSHEASNYGLEAEVESSFEAIRDIQVAAKAVVVKNDDEKATLDSKMLFKWNDIHHSLTLNGEKATKIRAQLVTKSTYVPLDDCVVNLEHQRSGKEMNTQLDASYQGQNVSFELWHSSTKTKEGHVRLTTPFESLATVYAEYKLNLGKEISYVAKFDRNNGANKIDVEAWGHVRSGDIDVDAKMRHSWGDDVTVGISYKNENSDMGAGASLKIGDHCGFNISGAVSSTSDRISSVSANFRRFHSVNPIDFDLRFERPGSEKIDLRSNLVLAGTEAAKVSVKAVGDADDGGALEASLKIFDCTFDVSAQSTFQPSQILESSTRFLKSEFSSGGKTSHKFLISFTSGVDRTSPATTSFGDFEVSLVSPSISSGITASRNVTQEQGDVAKTGILFSAFGQSQKLDLSFEQLSSPDVTSQTFDLKTTLPVAKHVKFDVETKDETYDEGMSTTMTIKGSINEANHFNLTGKNVLENGLDRTITVAYQGPMGPLLWSGTLRHSKEATIELESLLVDTHLEEHSFFVSMYKTDNAAAVYFNTTSPTSESLQVNLGYLMSVEDDGQVQVNIKVLYPTEFLDVRLFLDDDENYGSTFNGHFKAATFGIDQTMEGSVAFGRSDNEPFLRATVKVDDASGVAADATAILDYGTKRLPLGPHHLVKFDFKTTLTENGLTTDEKFVFAEGKLNGEMNDFSAVVKTSSPDHREYKLAAKLVGGKFESEIVKNDDRIGFEAELLNADVRSKRFEVQSRLESTFHSFEKIDLVGKLDLASSPKTVEILAKSGNGDYHVEVKSLLEDLKGQLKVTAVVPIINLNEKDLQIQYSIDLPSVDIVMTARGHVCDIHLEATGQEYTAIIKTPMYRYETINVAVKKSNAASQHSLDALVTVNDVTNFSLKSSVNLETYAIDFKLKTPLVRLSSLEFNAGIIQEWRGINFALTYLDENLATMKAFLSRDYLESQLIGSYKTSHSVKFEYDLKGVEKFIRVQHIGFHHVLVGVTYNEVIGKATVALNTLWTGDHQAEANWALAPKSGQVGLTVRCQNDEKTIGFKYDYDDNLVGIAKLETNVISSLSVVVKFDVGKSIKNVNVMTKWSYNRFTDLDLTYKMTEDTFDGTLVVKTSVRRWESTTFKAKYNISARPSASVSYEKDGVKKEILVEVALDNNKPVPTIFITTPIEGYENLILGGDVISGRDGRYGADFFVNCNGQKIVVFSNKVTLKSDFSTFELTSTLLTPIENWKSLLLEFGYKTTDPWVAKLRLVRDGEEFSVRGKISVNDREFKINAITPFEGFESVGLSGKFGTTSVGKQFGISFEQNTVRRDVSFEYGVSEDNVASLKIETPLRSARSIKIHTSTLSDDPSQKLKFGFETSGENNDFALGVAYDFTGGIMNGKIRINAQTSLIFLDIKDIDVNLDLSVVDGASESELSGKLQFSLNGAELVSAQTTYREGFVSVKVKTPVPDYANILLKIEINPAAPSISLLFELNGAVTSVTATMDSPEHIKVIIKTPAVGYELVTANYDVMPDGSRRVIIERSGIRLTELTIKTELKPNGGKIDIDWKATANIWAKFSGSHEDLKGFIQLQTASDKLKNLKVVYDIKLEKEIPRSEYDIVIDFNHYHLDYKSKTTLRDGDWEGWSEINTNIEALKFKKSVTNYKVQFNNDLSKPFVFVYKSTQDGAIGVDIDSSLDIQLTRGFDLKIHFLIPEIYPVAVDIKAKLEAELTGAQKSGKLTVSYASGDINYNVELDVKTSGKELQFVAKTNFGTASELKGRVAWTVKDGDYSVKFQLMLNGAKFLIGTVTFDLWPFSQLVISLQKGGNKQEIEVKWVPVHRANGRYQLQVSAKGMLEAKLDTKLTIAETSGQLDVAVMANTPLGSFDAAASAIVRFGRGVYGLEISTQNNRENRERKFKAEVNLQSPTVAALEIKASTLPFDLPNFQITLDYDLSSDLKTLKADFNMGNIKYNLDTKVNWSPESSVINIVAMRSPSGHKVVFKGERTGLNFMNYELDFLGTVIKFESNNNIVSPIKFDVSCKLQLPVYDEIGMKVSFALFGNPTLLGSISLKQNQVFSLKFVRADTGEFDLSASTPIPQVSSLQLSHTHSGNNNEYKLKWNNDNVITLNYDRVSDTKTVQLDAVVDGNKVASLDIKRKHPSGSSNFDFELKSVSIYFTLNIELNAKDGGFTFTADGRSPMVSSDAATVKAVYTRATQLEVEFKHGSREAKLTAGFSKNEVNAGTLKLTFSNNFLTKLKNVEFEGSAQFTAAKKSTALLLKVDGKIFSLEASGSNEDLELFVATPIPGIEYLKFETEISGRKYTVDLEYGKKGTPDHLEIEVELNNKESDVKFFKFDAKRGPNGYTLSGEIDLASMTFSSEATWPGKSIKLSTHYENGLLVGDLKTPFKNFEDVRFEGQWIKTATGATFKGSGDVNSLKHSFEAAYVIKANGFSINWKASKGATDELIFELLCNIESAKKLDAKLSLTGTAISSFLVEGSYEVTQNSFASKFSFNTPYERLASGKAEIEASFNYPSSFTFKAVAKTTDVIFDVNMALNMEAVNNKMLSFGAVVPALGINENDLKVSFGYKLVSPNDFEIVAEATIAGTPRKAILKFKFVGEKLDGELSLAFASRNVEILFGGRLVNLGPGGLTVSGYLNDCNVEFTFDGTNFAAKVLIDLQNKLLGVYDVVAAGMPNPITFDVKYEHLKSAKFAFKLGYSRHLSAAISLADDRAFAEIDFESPHFGHRSTAFVVEFGPQGRFEVTTKIDEGSHKLLLEADADSQGLRRGRAAVASPYFGDYEFALDKGSSSGIVVLTTSKGLHKISYDIKYTAASNFETDIQLESPYLNNGHAGGKLRVNCASHNYRAMFSLNNDHFLSASFDSVPSGFETAFGLQSSALPSEFQVSLSFQNTDQEVTGSFSLQLLSDQHSVKFSVRKDHPYAKVVVSSPLMSWITIDIEADLKKNGKEYNLGSTVQVGSLKMQINGEVTVNDCLDITGRFYYYGSGFKVTEARLSHKLKITGAQNYFDVIVTSDHPSLPEARFAVTAEVLSQDNDLKKAILFSVVTPVPRFETLSGKLVIPNPQVGLVAPFRTDLFAEVVFPNELGTHKINVDVDVKGLELSTVKLVHSKNGIEMAASQITLSRMTSERKFNLKAEISTACETFKSAKVALDFAKFGLLKGDFDLSVQWNVINKRSAKLSYEFIRNKFISAEVLMCDNKKFSVDLGMRHGKSFSALLQTPKGGLGGKISYKVQSLTNFDLEGAIDISALQIWWIAYNKAGFQAKLGLEPQIVSALKLNLDDNIFSLDFDSKSFSDRTEFNLKGVANGYKANGNLVKKSADDYAFTVDAVRNGVDVVVIRGHLKDEADDDRWSLTVDVNNRRKFEFTTDGKSCTIEAKEIMDKYGFKYTAFFEKNLAGEANRLQYSLSTFECDTEYIDNCLTERFEFIMNKNDDTGLLTTDVVVKAKWRNGNNSTFSAVNFKNACDFGKISYVENGVVVVGVESNVDTYFNVGGISMKKARYAVAFPDRSFILELNWSDWRMKQFEAKFLFGLTSEHPNLKGIAISHTSDFEGDVFVTEKISVRHVDTSKERNGAIEVTLRREGDAQETLNKFSRMLKLKMDHPTDDNLRLELMALADGKMVGSKINFDAEFSRTVSSTPRKSVSLNAEVDIDEKTLVGTFLSCHNQAYNFKGKILSYESSFNLESSIFKDGHEFADLNAEINIQAPSLQIQTKTGGATFFAGLQSEKEFAVILSRTKDAAELKEDFNAYARLTTEDVLTLGATWNPELGRELQRDFFTFTRRIDVCSMFVSWTDLNTARNILNAYQEKLSDDLRKVLFERVRMFHDAVSGLTRNILSMPICQNVYVMRAVHGMSNQLSVFVHYSSVVFERALEGVQVAYEVSADLISSAFVHAKNLMDTIAECGNNACRKIWSFFASFNIDLSRISKTLNSWVVSFKTAIENFVAWYHSTVESQTGQATIFIKELVRNIKKDAVVILVQISGFLKQFRVVNEALAFYYEYQSWFEEIHFSQHLENTIMQLQTYVDDSTRQFDQWKRHLVKIFIDAKQFIVSKYETVSHYPIFAYVATAAKRVYRVGAAVVEQFSVDAQLRRMAEKVFGQIDSVTSVVVRIVDVIYGRRDLAGYELEYRPSEGVFSYNQVLPFKWFSFKELPDVLKLVQAVGLGAAEDEGDFNFVDFQHDLLDAIHTIGAALATRSLVPPFSARAMISGDSHLMTFDNKFYDFSGSQGCSYLLTSDFLHNRFSVVANYAEDLKRTSLTVVTDNKRVDIDTKSADDGETIKVTIDRRVVELPQTFMHTHIKREGSSLILENSEGLRVVCNSAYDVCSVTVSGWYFGKTGGLFGVYDYEPSNDWMTPERRIVDNLQEFASSWQLDKSNRCPIKHQTPDTSLVSDSDRQKCGDILGGETSSLMPCYTTVDVAPFQRMCIADAAKQSGTGFCSAAAAYIEQCKLSGVELWMPAECVRCESTTSTATLRSGESKSYQNNAPMSADVVFVIEQASCLQSYSISDLPAILDRELTQRGLTENRFAIVGFGGPEDLLRPHVFTAGSKIFSDSIKVTSSFSNLKTTGSGGPVFGALKYAGRLPFRSGVSKSVVLITCSPGTDGSFYGDAMTMLTEQAITLHHLTAGSSLSWRGSKTKSTDKIYGFSKTSVFTIKNLSDFKGDNVLRKQLKDPKDFLSTLATESGGTVFALNKFEAAEAKRSATIFSIQIATRAEPAPCQVCDCVADADGVGRLQCHKCILPAMDIVLKNWEQYQQLFTN